MGGLQLFLDLVSIGSIQLCTSCLTLSQEPIGHVLQAEVLGCVFDEATADYSCEDIRPEPSPGFDPPQMMIGCHRTRANPTPRLFASGSFDELAIWNQRLNDTQKPYFLGGFSESFSVTSLIAAALISLQSWLQSKNCKTSPRNNYSPSLNKSTSPTRVKLSRYITSLLFINRCVVGHVFNY